MNRAGAATDPVGAVPRYTGKHGREFIRHIAQGLALNRRYPAEP